MICMAGKRSEEAHHRYVTMVRSVGARLAICLLRILLRCCAYAVCSAVVFWFNFLNVALTCAFLVAVVVCAVTTESVDKLASGIARMSIDEGVLINLQVSL